MRGRDTHFSVLLTLLKSLTTTLRDEGICFSISLMRKLRHREVQQPVSGKLGAQLCPPVTEPGSFARHAASQTLWR